MCRYVVLSDKTRFCNVILALNYSWYDYIFVQNLILIINETAYFEGGVVTQVL